MSSDPVIWLANQYYTKVVGNVVPTRWLGVDLPPLESLSIPTGRLKLEIVSHCWQYAHLLVYQLSSLVKYTPKTCDITYTLFYSTEDSQTVELISQFDDIDIPGIKWQWIPIAKEKLFRRAIGRHQITQSTNSDWLWFSDCDLIFHQGCLDSLAESLRGQQIYLAYPASENVTEMLPADHTLIVDSLKGDLPVDIDPSVFKPNTIEKAKGAFQIVHADLARKVGYCGNIGTYQKPDSHWRKTYEDTAFRKLIGTDGVPVDVRALHRIRHQSKGRYKENSALSNLRRTLRRIKD